MKKSAAAILMVMVLTCTASSQSISWRALRADQPNVMQFNFGYDFGMTGLVGYSRSFTFFKPIVVGLDYSFPMGSDLLDDFKVKLGGQSEILQFGGFSTSIKISSILRRHETPLVRIVSFGSDMGVVSGYYRPSWFVAGEFGFDKSIVSNFKHSSIMRSFYPAVRDGWYIPTGGNYYYGLQLGKSLGESLDLSLRVGVSDAQGNDEDATMPAYAQLGLGMKF